jgi:hypothetical protein
MSEDYGGYRILHGVKHSSRALAKNCEGFSLRRVVLQ